MSRLRNAELTPIHRLPETSNRFRVNISLPEWVDTERIGVNVKKTEKLLDLGGISTANILSETHRTYSEIPTAVGVTKNGELIAGKVSAKSESPVERFSHEPGEMSYMRNLHWAEVQVWLNLLAIEERIANERKALRSIESWIPHLDNGARSGLRNAGTHHLIKDFTAPELKWVLFVYGHNVLMGAADISLWDILTRSFNPHIPTPVDLAVILAGNFLGWNVMMKAYHWKKYRASLLPGYEIDKAAQLQIQSRHGKIFEVIPKALQAPGITLTR